MPKTASKRARARRTARVTRAHRTVLERSVPRGIPAARRGRRRPTGLAGFVNNYPWATTIFAILLVGGLAGIVYNAHANHQWIWTPTPKQASCNLKTHTCDKPPMTIDKNKLYIATIKTAKGNIVVQLDAKTAPITVNNFVYLANQRFYDGLTFHRVLHLGQPSAETNGQPSSLGIIQGGDPKGNGQGGPGYSFSDEPVVGTYTAGAIAMAKSGPNTNGSQFFICTADDTAALAKSYNLFGQVISGLDVAQKIQAGDKMLSVTIAVRNAPTPMATTNSHQVTVDITGSGYTGTFHFSPATITIKVGTTVVWNNASSAPHTSTSDTGSAVMWDSMIEPGATFSFTFTRAGTFAYHCNIHPYMHATIVVTS